MKFLYSLLAVIILILFASIGVGLLNLRFLFAVIIPYAAVTIFIAGLIYRVLKWARTPVPFHIPVVTGQQKSLPWIKASNIGSPYNTAGVIGRMALEVFLFRSLFRNEKVELEKSGNLAYKRTKYLWLGGLVFHWSLFFILFRHLRFFFEPVPSVVRFVADIDGIFKFPILFYITTMLILIALTYLVLRRVISPQIRYISLPADYFAVLLFVGIVLFGILVRFYSPMDFAGAKMLAMGLVRFQPIITEWISWLFYVHLFLVSILFAYFPFSKLVHTIGIFLSPTLNLKNDSRMRRHINPWNYPVKSRTYGEWEDDYREKMKKAGLPLEKE